MNRPFFHPLAALALFAALACAGSAGNTPGAQTGARLGRWIPGLKTVPTRSDCSGAAAENRTSCHQAFLDDVLKRKGMDSAMTVLTGLATAEPVVRANSHMFAHSLGLAAFTTPAELAAVFAKCSPGFQSGCYHGVIQGYFLDFRRRSPGKAVGAEEVNALCRDFRGDDSRWLLFQCAHGLGHGLELIYSHDLPRALAGCDLVSSSSERPACYGGAFMENIVSVTNPHQTAEGIAAGMGVDGMNHEMGGMDMPGMDHSDSAHGFRKFDPADPHYPCSVLPRRYGSQCYLIQTSLMLFENHGDFAAAAATCETAPAQFRPECFVSLGRDANSYAGGDAARAAGNCAAAPEAFRPLCHTGVAKNLVDITADPSGAFAYCSSLAESVSKVTCYSAVGEEIRSLSPDSAKLKEFCSAATPPFDAACRYGAGVTSERPATLPKRE